MPHVCGCVVDNAPGYDSYSRYCGTNCSVAHPCGAVPAPRRAVLVQTRTPPGMFPGGVLRVLHCWPGETPGTPQKRTKLLDRDGGAGALKGSLRLLRGVLVDLLKDGLRRAVDQVLGLLESKAGERAHLLDDLDLLVTSGLKDDVELVLLLGLFGGGATSATSRGGNTRDRDRGGGLDVERVLERLHELGQLKKSHLLELVKQFRAAELRHNRFPSFP